MIKCFPLLLLGACVSTSPVQVDRPPQKYQFEQTVSTIIMMDPEAAAKKCRSLGAGSNAISCTDLDNDWTIVPNPCAYSERYADLLCHEKGHLSGWSKEHPLY